MLAGPLLLVCGLLFAQEGGVGKRIAPLEVKPVSGMSEAGFAENYLEWLAHGAAIDHFDENYMTRIEEARFAASEYHKYLDQQPFLSAPATKFARFLEDLDAVQDRVRRWKKAGNEGAPAYEEAVAGYQRKTIYSGSEPLSAEALKRNYFARRYRGGQLLKTAVDSGDRDLAVAAYDLFVGALGNVPPGERYDPYRVDVLRAAMRAGRHQFLLKKDTPDRGFAKSINPADAFHVARAGELLRSLAPADPYGNIRAAAAIGRWGSGDAAGAYREVVPATQLRKKSARFGIFCARLASVSGKADDALAWLEQAARVDIDSFPSVDVLMNNPDFAALREKEKLAFLGLTAKVKRHAAYREVERIAKAAAAQPGALSLLKEMNDLVPEISGTSKELQASAIATVILGLRGNGREAGTDVLQKQFLARQPSTQLMNRLSDKALTDSCEACNGSGVDLEKNQRCSKCGGAKICKFEYCKRGKKMSPFDLPKIRRGLMKPEPCGDCRGSGKCRACKGRGKMICGNCNGGGKAISKVKVLAQFRKVAEQTAALAATERVAFLEQIRLPSN